MNYRYEIQIQDPETGLWSLAPKQISAIEKEAKHWWFGDDLKDRATQRKEVKALLDSMTSCVCRVIELTDSIDYWEIIWEKGNWV